MKKENIIKKIMIQALVGFPIGIALLMINYASIYLIAGEDIFKTELLQLQNFTTLVFQLSIVGLAGYLFFIIIGATAYLIQHNFTVDKFEVEHPLKSLLIILLLPLSIVIIISVFSSKIFTDIIAMMSTCSFVIIYILCTFALCIKKAIMECNSVKKINQKLKERNNQ